jgi:hypothetical protein
MEKRMSIDALERHLERSGYVLDGDVYRHPHWLGWVTFGRIADTWVAADANDVRQRDHNLAELLRRVGAPALVGTP